MVDGLVTGNANSPFWIIKRDHDPGQVIGKALVQALWGCAAVSLDFSNGPDVSELLWNNTLEFLANGTVEDIVLGWPSGRDEAFSGTGSDPGAVEDIAGSTGIAPTVRNAFVILRNINPSLSCCFC